MASPQPGQRLAAVQVPFAANHGGSKVVAVDWHSSFPTALPLARLHGAQDGPLVP